MSVSQDRPLRAVLWCAVSSAEQAADEKASLREQERELRELANCEGWQIVEVLIVPGFSRRYYNFPEFAQAAVKEGIEAGERLLEHLDRRDFDVFACRDGSRFGREQSIFGEVVARVIDSGARLRTLVDGWIDIQNYRMYISMAGYAAAGAVDHLKRNQSASKDKLAARGLPTNHRHSPSHRVIRNEYGRAIKMIPDESKRRFYEDAALLLIEGVGYVMIEEELYRRFGHGENGKPYKRYAIYHTFWNPQFWGHSARNHKT